MWVTISTRDEPARSHQLDPGVHTIGRDNSCDIVIADPHVSQRHATLEVTPTGAWLTDLGSTNGTFLEDDRISGKVWVAPDSRLRLATVAVFVRRNPPTDPIPLLSPDAASRRTTSPGSSEAPPVAAQSAPVVGAAPRPPIGPPAVPSAHMEDAGLVAGHDVWMDGQHVAGRDLHVHEGFTLRSKMRRSAKRCIRLGVVLLLAGMGLVGYFVVTYNSRIFDAINSDSDEFPDTLDPVPWLPAGFGASFVGIVLVVAGLLVPRDKVVVPSKTRTRGR